MKGLVLATFILLFSSGCSKHYSNFATQVVSSSDIPEETLVVSNQKNSDMSYENIFFIETAFENRTEKKMEIKNIFLSFDDNVDYRRISILFNYHLRNYIELALLRIEKKRLQKEKFLAILSIAASVGAIASNVKHHSYRNNPTTYFAYGKTFKVWSKADQLSLSTFLLYKNVEDSHNIDRINEKLKVRPENYLIGSSLILFPDTVVKKFIVLQIDLENPDDIENIYLHFTEVQNHIEIKKVMKLEI